MIRQMRSRRDTTGQSSPAPPGRTIACGVRLQRGGGGPVTRTVLFSGAYDFSRTYGT